MKYTVSANDYNSLLKLAVEKQAIAVDRGWKHANGYSNLTYAEQVYKDTDSMCAEMVLARYLDIPWKYKMFSFKNEADVGANNEVKNTHYLNGCLMVSDNDRPDDIAWLVVGSYPHFWIKGYMPMFAARVPRFKISNGTYKVPADQLREPETYKRSIYYGG